MNLSGILARVLAASAPVRLGTVGAILDRFGGVRVIVTDTSRTLEPHTGPDELAYIVPGFLEPMYAAGDGAARDDGMARPRWNRSAVIIETATAHLEAQQPSKCGACRICCITPYVAKDRDGFTKPSHTPCHNLCAAGCKRYKTRPVTCATFECLWLKSQSGNRPMAPELRPDRAGAMLTDLDAGPIRVHVTKGKKVSHPLSQWIEAMKQEGDDFLTVTHYYGEGT